MRGLLRTYLRITHAFGSTQRFWRRLAALCLVVMGVHATADNIDDLVFAAVDTLDLWADQGVWAAMDWLAQMGGMTPAEAVQKAQAFAELVDMEEKDKFALVLALAVEIGIDLMLVGWIWGTRRSTTDLDATTSIAMEFRQSVDELRQALWPLDLQRIAIPVALLLFSLAGAFSAALAIESIASNVIGNTAPLWKWGINTAAGIGILSTAILTWRFVPDLIHGGILHAHVLQERRDAKAKSVAEQRAADNVAASRWDILKRGLKRVTRGLFSFVVLVPLAVFGLMAQNAFVELVARAGANL